MTAFDNKTQWAKLGTITNISFIGKEVAFYGTGCHLNFLNINTKQERLYLANSNKRGDGVQYYVGHRSQSMFAFAEKKSNPQIFIKQYPSFENICCLKDGDERGYLSMVFSDRSMLITLGDLPHFKIVVWNWRRGEKMAYQNGSILSRQQFLKCSLGSSVCLVQLGVNTKLLNTWDIHSSGKNCILTQHQAKIDFNCKNFKTTLWTADGGLFVLDYAGCVYTVYPDHHLEKVIDFTNTGDNEVWFVSYKGGIAVCGPNREIRYYKKSGTWSVIWTIVPPESVLRLEARAEILLAITSSSNILQIIPAQNDFKYLKKSQNQFNDFCLIYPSGQYILALSQQHFIYCYKVETGDLISSMELKGTASLLVENPKFPYAAVAFDPGTVQLISAFNTEKLNKMTEFNLTKEAINSIRFNECGTIFVAANTNIGIFFIIEGYPGCQMNIIAIIEAKHQIVDHMMVASLDCYRIFMIPVTTSNCLAGNVLIRYCVTKTRGIDMKTYHFNITDGLYNRIIGTFGPLRDRIFYVVSYNGKMMFEVEIQKGSYEATLTRTMMTGHQMRGINFKLDRLYALTWSYDGLIIARSSDCSTNIAIALPHHRYQGGVQKAYIVPYEKYIVSLGRDGALICTDLALIDVDNYTVQELEAQHFSDQNELLFSRRTLGFAPKGKYEGKSYMEYQEMKQIEKESIECRKERNSILEEFKSIQKELQELLTINLEGPDNEKLNLAEFNLNVKQHQEKCLKHKKLREATENYLRNLIEAQNKISQYMIVNFWSKMKIPGTALKAIFERFEVTNYVLRPPDENREEVLQSVRQQRKIEKHLSEMNSFHPWEPIAEEKLIKILEEPTALEMKDQQKHVLSVFELDKLDVEEVEEDPETKIAFSGSDIARFIEVQDAHYLQNELQTYFQTELQWIISKSDCYKIKEFFNEKFNVVMMQKLKEMGNIKQKNDRLRHIVSELNYFSEDRFSVTIDDPMWKQVENPELLTQVKDDEVPITPYISPSEQAILDAKAAEAERLRLLLLADDFRERALMAMMNGVLEVRWEDELRKNVPLPKCMIEKEPENFNEDDLRAVKDYEEKVNFLNSERERYKTLLRAEYGKLADSVRENIKKFNGKLSDLLDLKLLVDSAISHESLRINRVKLFQHNRKVLMEKEQELLQKISENDEVIGSIMKLMHMLHDTVQECKNFVESFQTKDKYLERAYKKDFQDLSIVVQEQSLKLYRKRPKVNFRTMNSATLLNELARNVMGAISEISTLTSDCVDFLKQLDNLDQFFGIPTVIDEHIFALICKHRRAKIDYEIRLKAAQTDLAEAETTCSAFNKRLQLKKEKSTRLYTSLNGIRQDLSNLMCNGDMQIVLPKGLVEVPLTGVIEDFKDSILVCRKDVENINSVILDVGNRKIKVLKKNMNFRRKIMKMEWDHKRLRMLLEDLQEKSIDIDGVKLTKEIQTYLKCKDKEKAIPFETEVDMIKASYENTIQDRKDKVQKMKKQINGLKAHDESILQKITEINVDVCEMNLSKDTKLPEYEQKVIDDRMRALLKRSKLIQQVQDNHHQILMLQTELELLRLKTFPTLKYKMV